MKIRNFTVTTRYSDTPRMKIPVYTTSRQDVPARRLRRHRYLTIIAVQCNAETASLKERMTDLTVKQVEICLLKAEIGHLKHLHLHLEHLHLQRGLPAPSPTLQVSTSPTTWPATAPLHITWRLHPQGLQLSVPELHSAIPGNLCRDNYTNNFWDTVESLTVYCDWFTDFKSR